MTAPVPPGTRFTALVDFPWPELGSHYCKGLSYTVREGDAALAALVPVWESEGKVKVDKNLTSAARASGSGTVK